MIQPINNHILIKPLTHESFIASSKETYEEIGLVEDAGIFELHKGDKVYFDSWLAAKYPTGKDNEFFWLVKYEDIRAIDTN